MDRGNRKRVMSLGRGRVARAIDPLAATHGIALEISIVSKADDPLLYLERQAYISNLHGMLGGVEAARAVLAQARQRLDR